MSKRSENSNRLTSMQKTFMELEDSKSLDGLYTELKSLWRLIEVKDTATEVKHLLKVICDYTIDDISRGNKRERATSQPALELNGSLSNQNPSARSYQTLKLPMKVNRPPKPTRSPKEKLSTSRKLSSAGNSIYSEYSNSQKGGAFNKAKRTTLVSKDFSPGPAAYNTSMELLYQSSPSAVIPKSIYRRMEFNHSSSPGPAYYSPRRSFLSRF